MDLGQKQQNTCLSNMEEITSEYKKIYNKKIGVNFTPIFLFTYYLINISDETNL